MKKQVYTDSNKCSYITAGKFYDFTPAGGDESLGYIVDDMGDKIIIRPEECNHIMGDSWTVVEVADKA